LLTDFKIFHNATLNWI